ncbi:hypothetical protein JOF53_006456 [Crossiella equi]|uniref:Uncharacterized protein n=1 Tax=Crossiella equi TaxID=130796 RepID=A0ABS5AM02_9PSEU|nr:hypothetical protein [Crossiella equi]MBP2477584.1 hypothetical protein [Crossiella equi]
MNSTNTEELDLFGDPVEPVHELHHHLGEEAVELRVRRKDLVHCLGEDVRLLARLRNRITLTAKAVPVLRRGDALAVQGTRHQLNQAITVLCQLQSCVRTSTAELPVFAAAALAHHVMHGQAGTTATTWTEVRGLPFWIKEDTPGPFAVLLTLREAAENLVDSLGKHTPDAASRFRSDLRTLQRWVAQKPDLRAPDVLEPDPVHRGRLVQLRHQPRPCTPRLAEQIPAVTDYETLSTDQLQRLHEVLRSDGGPLAAVRTIREPHRPRTVRDAVQSVSRFGIWVRQSLLSGTPNLWVSRALGVTTKELMTKAGLEALLRHQVQGGAEQAELFPSESSGVLRIDSGWFDRQLGGVPDAIRLAAVLYTPEVAAWYQIVRGDVHDLVGYTPMRQAHYAALIGHVAGGGTLSDYAALQGRRYADVLTAWQRLSGHARRSRTAAADVTVGIAALPQQVDLGTAEAALAQVERILDLVGNPDQAPGTLRAAVSAVTTAQQAGEQDTLRRTYRLLVSRLLRLRNRVLGQVLPQDLTTWTAEEVSSFYAQYPELVSVVEDPVLARSRAITAIRGEVERLLAARPAGAPRTAIAALTELHHSLATALRRGRDPRLRAYWSLDLAPTGEHHHVWATFTEWPDIVTVVTTAKQLTGQANSA